MQKKTFRLLWVAIAFGCFSAILILWLVRYGPTWPYRDSFGYLFFLDEIEAGKVGILEFIAVRNNEHFVAFHYAAAISLLLLTGLQAKALMFANAALLIVSCCLIYAAVSSSVERRLAAIALPFLIAIPLINPVQTSYLIWEFQIWLYIDIALLAANCFLIERYGLKAYPLVVIFCIMATGSEAQGSFLWIASGIHILCVLVPARSASRRKAGLAILLAHSLIFLIAAWLLMHGKYIAAYAAAGQSQSLMEKLLHMVQYFVTLVGGGFGIRNPQFALLAGAVSLIFWAIGTAWSINQRFSTPLLRVAFILSATSLLWVAAFTVGRKSLGIDWAFGHFHASPLLLPFFAGIGLYGIAFLETQASVAIGAVLVSICIIPSFASIPFGYHRSVEMKANSLMTEDAECVDRNVSDYLKLHLNGIEGRPELYSEIERYREQLCSNIKDLDSLKGLVLMPTKWIKLSSGNPRDIEALSMLWSVYLTHGDLLSAFPESSPTNLDDLLRWAAGDAKNGSKYDRETLSPYADTYIALESTMAPSQ